MNKKTGLTIALLLISLTLPNLYGQQKFLLKNDIVVDTDEVQENVITFGGNILIKGRVKNSAIAFGGTITVEGEVGELILGLGTHITMKSSARAAGDVVSLGGTLEKEPGTIIEGDTIFFKTSEDFKTVLREGLLGRLGFSLIPFLILLKLVMAFIWFILAIVLVAIFPRQIHRGAAQIRKSFWPIFGIGILGLVIFVGLVIFSAFLSFILIGLPILLSLVIIGIVIKIFGQVILFYFFGESLGKSLGKKQPSPLMCVILGFILVTIVGLIPLFGPLFSFVISLIGWGVVIRTKFGTTDTWPAKKTEIKPVEL